MPKITSKGQVTIPRKIRQLLGIAPGDQVEFHVLPNRQVVVTPASSRSSFSRYAGYLTHKAGQDPDQLIAQLRDDAE